MVAYMARPHSGDAFHLGLPPRELLEPYIDRTTDQGTARHWYWDGSFLPGDALGGDRPQLYAEASFRWNVAGKGGANYVVVRLLLHYDVAPLRRHSRVFNTCGLVQCVRTDHWRVAKRAVETPTGERRTREQATAARVPLGKKTDIHCIDPYRRTLALCGRELDPGPDPRGRPRPPLRARSRRVGVTCTRCHYTLSMNPAWPIPD